MFYKTQQPFLQMFRLLYLDERDSTFLIEPDIDHELLNTPYRCTLRSQQHTIIPVDVCLKTKKGFLSTLSILTVESNLDILVCIVVHYRVTFFSRIFSLGNLGQINTRGNTYLFFYLCQEYQNCCMSVWSPVSVSDGISIPCYGWQWKWIHWHRRQGHLDVWLLTVIYENVCFFSCSALLGNRLNQHMPQLWLCAIWNLTFDDLTCWTICSCWLMCVVLLNKEIKKAYFSINKESLVTLFRVDINLGVIYSTV